MLRIPQKNIHDYFLLEDFQHDFTYILDILKQVSKNATDYGITGIETDDNTDKIQELFDTAGNIYFPEGTYTLTKRLNVYSNTTITLHPKAMFVRKHPASMVQTATTTETTGYNGEKNIRFNGGIYKHNGHADGSNVFSLFHAEDIIFNDVTCLDTVEAHCLDIVGCNNIKVYNCKFKGYIATKEDTNKEAIQIDAAGCSAYPIYATTVNAYDGTPSCNITVENCVFCKSDDNPSYPVAIGQHGQHQLNGGRYRNIKISNNLMIGDPSWTYSYGIRPISWDGAVISGNTIENYKTSIFIDMFSKVVGSHGDILKDSSNIPNKADGETLFLGCRDINITNNVFKPAVSTSSKPCIQVNIANEVYNSLGADIPTHKNIIIVGNTLNLVSPSVKSYGVDMDATENVVINGNTIINNAKSDSVAVYCQDYCKNVVIGDNIYENLTEDNVCVIKSTCERVKKKGKTTLWTGMVYGENETITLSRPLNEFDAILVEFEFFGTQIAQMDFSTTTTQSFRNINLADSASSATMNFFEARIKKVDETTLTHAGNKMIKSSDSSITTNDATYYVKAIYGINY